MPSLRSARIGNGAHESEKTGLVLERIAPHGTGAWSDSPRGGAVIRHTRPPTSVAAPSMPSR